MNTTTPIALAFQAIMFGISRWIFWSSHNPNPPNLNKVDAAITRFNNWRRRLEALVLAWERDLLPAKRLPAPRTRTPSKKRPYVPNGKGWAAKVIPWDFGAQMTALANRDDIKELVKAAPQAGRILRPLLNSMREPIPAHLALPPRPKRVRPRKPKEPRIRRRHFTRAQIDRMTAAELKAIYPCLPPHFPLPIPNLNYIRRKIAAG